MNETVASGTIFIHSTMRAMCLHLEAALSHVLERPMSLRWDRQVADPGLVRAEFEWSHGDPNTGMRLTQILRSFKEVRFEVIQHPATVSEGQRWMFTPALGVHYSQIDLLGNLVLPENLIRNLIAQGGSRRDLEIGLKRALGQAWDEELEYYRAQVVSGTQSGIA